MTNRFDCSNKQDELLSLDRTLQMSRALFSSEKWKVFGTVALSFVCDNIYLIMD